MAKLSAVAEIELRRRRRRRRLEKVPTRGIYRKFTRMIQLHFERLNANNRLTQTLWYVFPRIQELVTGDAFRGGVGVRNLYNVGKTHIQRHSFDPLADRGRSGNLIIVRPLIWRYFVSSAPVLMNTIKFMSGPWNRIYMEFLFFALALNGLIRWRRKEILLIWVVFLFFVCQLYSSERI